MSGSPTHRMAKWLANRLKLVENCVNQNVVLDSFQFVETVRRLDLSNLTMASLDITSLFTQIPLDETIDILIDLINTDNIDIGIPDDLLRDMILLCTKNVSFSFNKDLYTQHDGVAMGSPLGPCLANIFVGFLERKFRSKISESCEAYFRYVDDTFVVCKSESQVQQLQNLLNSMHPNLKFTVELEQRNQLPFLDVLVIRDGVKTKTKVYRKPSWSGVYLHFHSFVPFAYKSGLIRTLFDRARKISSPEFLAGEERFLTDALRNNGYPSHVIAVFSRPRAPKPYGPDKKTVYIHLPFFGDRIADRYQNLISKSVCSAYSFVKPIIIWKCKRIPQRSLKDPTPPAERCGIIYEFNCACSSTYVGRTSRTLRDRVREHVPRWVRSGRTQPPRSTNQPASSITQHLTRCAAADLACLDDYFKIIFSGTPGFRAHVLEALVIARRSPDLCRQKNGVYRLLLPW